MNALGVYELDLSIISLPGGPREFAAGRVQILPFGLDCACSRPRARDSRCHACLSPGRQAKQRSPPYRAAAGPSWKLPRPPSELVASSPTPIILARKKNRSDGRPIIVVVAAAVKRGRAGDLTGLWQHRSWQSGSCTGRQGHCGVTCRAS